MGTKRTPKRNDKKENAQALFLTGKYQKKEIAKMVGVAENTVGRWVKEGKWEYLRANLTTTKESILASWYGQLAEINSAVEKRPEGERYATTSETDRMIKISASIKKLETEAGISEIIDVSINFLEWIRESNPDKAKELSDLFDAWIKSKL